MKVLLIFTIYLHLVICHPYFTTSKELCRSLLPNEERHGYQKKDVTSGNYSLIVTMVEDDVLRVDIGNTNKHFKGFMVAAFEVDDESNEIKNGTFPVGFFRPGNDLAEYECTDRGHAIYHSESYYESSGLYVLPLIYDMVDPQMKVKFKATFIGDVRRDVFQTMSDVFIPKSKSRRRRRVQF